LTSLITEDTLTYHLILCYTKGTPFHWLLFYQECQPSICKQKQKSTEEPNPEAILTSTCAACHSSHAKAGLLSTQHIQLCQCVNHSL
jgi:hypothetical protein